MERRAEEKQHRAAKARGAGAPARCVRVHDRPPEEQGGAEEAQVLERVNGVAAQRRLIQRRRVPEPDRDAVDEKRDERPGKKSPRSAKRGLTRHASNAPARSRW